MSEITGRRTNLVTVIRTVLPRWGKCWIFSASYNLLLPPNHIFSLSLPFHLPIISVGFDLLKEKRPKSASTNSRLVTSGTYVVTKHGLEHNFITNIAWFMSLGLCDHVSYKAVFFMEVHVVHGPGSWARHACTNTLVVKATGGWTSATLETPLVAVQNLTGRAGEGGERRRSSSAPQLQKPHQEGTYWSSVVSLAVWHQGSQACLTEVLVEVMQSCHQACSVLCGHKFPAPPPHQCPEWVDVLRFGRYPQSHHSLLNLALVNE